jgi:hypothetical protein
MNQMTLEQKNRAILSSGFINDTEENIQATEELIRNTTSVDLLFHSS